MSNSENRNKTIGFWIVTALVVAELMFAGIGNFLRLDFAAEGVVNTLGYPEYFMTLLGTGKLIGAVVLAAPGLKRLKEWAYAGVSIVMISAAASHAFAGDPFSVILPPVVFLGLALGSYTLRPSSRRLAG